MLKLEEAWDYKEYLISSLKKYKLKQQEIYKKIVLLPETVKNLKKIQINTNIIVFAEIYCPDSRVIIPILEKMRLENKKINLFIFPRVGNEKYMALNTEQSRIPSVMVEDISIGEDELVLIYEEFLPDFKEKLKLTSDPKEREELIYNYRTGKFNDEIQFFLTDKILKIVN